MSDDFERIQRGHNHGLMVAGYRGVTNAVSSLDDALRFVEFASRGGIPTTGPVMSMARVEEDLRKILARVEAVNARRPAIETKDAA